MNYPSVAEYTAAVRLAEDNMATHTSLRPVLDSYGDPLMSGGNFAAVFKMHDEASGRDYAMKCFLKEQTGRCEAYEAIMHELEYVNTSYLTHFQYLDRELFVDMQGGDDNEFPVLLMDWVEGQTLDKYVRQHLDDDYALSLLAYQFSRMAMWLLSQPFAHGDLKPDNILVRSDGSLVLVDYDGMFVPAMQGQKARELGSPDFRHPLRTIDDFNEHIDDFALASILLSLKAIALDPTLIDRHAAPDRLLFGEADYRDLSQCAILKELYPSADPDLNLIISLFTIAHAKKSLANVSFRLLDIERPEEKPIQEETISTEVTDEDEDNAWIDEYGAKYSSDRQRLLIGSYEIENYFIRQGTKVICDGAFWNCESLEEITIPKSVTHIGDSAFYGCSSLQEITIPKSVTHIGDFAFSWCESLQEITIPNSVSHIGDSVFSCCKSLLEIIIPQGTREKFERLLPDDKDRLVEQDENISTEVTDEDLKNAWEDEYGVKYSKNGKRLLLAPRTTEFYTIKQGTKVICDEAFKCHDSFLQEITMPNSVTHIGNSAFADCLSLWRITLSDSVSYIGDFVFEDCHSLEEINIPNSVTHIGIGAFFRCSSLIDITIPNSVTHIGNVTFGGCKSLLEITLPNSIASIGNCAFLYCFSLQEITIPNSVAHIEDGTFEGCESLEKITIPDSVTHIGNSAFCECASLEEISIPNSVSHIGGGAFNGCINLKQMICKSNSFLFGNSAFYTRDKKTLISYMGKDSSFIIPDSVTHIEKSAFSNCKSLYVIDIPDSVTHIGDAAFSGCKSLQRITIPNSVSHIGDGAFSLCISLKEIIIPQGSRDKFEEMLPDYKDKLVER